MVLAEGMPCCFPGTTGTGISNPPQHAGECHRDGAVPGYAAYGINRGATLKVDVEEGRFVFYYLPLDF